MIIKHRTQRRYAYGGSGIFNVISNLVSKVATKAPEVLARAQANKLISQVVNKSMTAGQKALIDNSDRLTTGIVNKVVDKIVKPNPSVGDIAAKKQASALINSLTQARTSPVNSNSNLNSLIAGMGLKPVKSGNGITLD